MHSEEIKSELLIPLPKQIISIAFGSYRPATNSEFHEDKLKTYALQRYGKVVPMHN
jgi:hypothetical protein